MISALTQNNEKQVIHFLQDFEVSAQTVFNFFSVHENWGKFLPAAVKCIQFGEDPRDANSKGSVRRIIAFPIVIEETVTQYIPYQFIEYKLTYGFGVKNHLGIMNFIETDTNKCRLDYQIEFQPVIPFSGFVIKNLLEKIMGQGVRDVAHKLRINPNF
ncbi:MAG: SRPBCC family protein [Chitinophagales bacterium]|nr:SRPBCC family protein [Chitinophagales bacterium]